MLRDYLITRFLMKTGGDQHHYKYTIITREKMI